MTQAIGLLSLVLLLAFSLLLLALASATARMLRRRDAMAARGPLSVISVLVLVVPTSFLTWGKPILDFGLISIGSLADWTGEMLSANPLSWICFGPLGIGLLASTLAPEPRKWIAGNYLALSIVALSIAIVGGALALLLMLGGGWAILAVVTFLGVAVGLGSHGLVFVPHLDDGPRVGEGTASALPRIASARARRFLYQTIELATSTPRLFFTRDAAIIALVLVTIAAVGIAYKNQPVEPMAELMATAVYEATPLPTLTTVIPTPTPQLVAFKVANTADQGVLLREQPSRNARAVASLMEGATVEPVNAEAVEAEGINWQRVKDSGGAAGWVSAQYLEPVHSFGMAKVTNTGGDGVFLRAKPGKSAGQIGVVHEGAELRVVGVDVQAEGKTWRNVSDGKGTSGWISAEFLTPSWQ